MFSFLFGKPAAGSTRATAGAVAAAAAPRPSGPSDSTMATLKMLSERESDLDKRITFLEKNVARITAEAVTAHKAGEKDKAIRALKKKNMYEEQIKTNSAMLLKIMEQKGALESVSINTDTLSVMSHANAALRAEQATWSVDRVKDLTDELAEVKEAHREIIDLLQEPLTDGPSEEDLLEELEGMTAAAAAPAPAPVAAGAAAPTNTHMLDLPAVPTTALPAAGGAGTTRSEEIEMLRELNALAAV